MFINYGMENKEFKSADAATPGRIISEIKKLLLPEEETMEQELCLVRPTIQMKEQALEYREEHFKNGEKVINGSEILVTADIVYVLLNEKEATLRKCCGS